MDSPFGTNPRQSRWRRALVYFGLAEDPSSGHSAPAGRPRRVNRRARPTEQPVETRGRRALVYFGLAEGEPPSRYGDTVARELDDDVDALRERVARLEEALARRRENEPG